MVVMVDIGFMLQVQVGGWIKDPVWCLSTNRVRFVLEAAGRALRRTARISRRVAGRLTLASNRNARRSNNEHQRDIEFHELFLVGFICLPNQYIHM
jgi:hypothetical protein